MTYADLYRAGWTIERIAKTSSKSVKQVRAELIADGVKLRSRGGRYNPNIAKQNQALSTYRRPATKPIGSGTWQKWADENPDLITELRARTGNILELARTLTQSTGVYCSWHTAERIIKKAQGTPGPETDG